MSAQTLGLVAPTALAPDRIELHWLAQILAATGNAFLEAAPDDGQSNVAWNPDHSALVGRGIGNGARMALAIAEAELLIIDADGSASDRLHARGKTLAELLTWAGDRMTAVSGASFKTAPELRDYEMPEHGVAEGQAFSFDDGNRNARGELALWFQSATGWLAEARALDSRASEVRCWPHHFDIGGIIMLEPDKSFEEARQMGFGWSPGDTSYSEPYFYVTPFPVPAPLPELTNGHWHREGFTGAILTGTEVANGSSQNEMVRRFLRQAIEQTLPLITP